MSPCLQASTRIGLSGFKFSQFAPAYALNLACGASQYLRPDVGGALVPYIYTAAILLVHGPVLWERIHHWEKVQEISLCLAAFNIVVILASYISSRFEPGQVLVWMPLTATLDAGAMLQLIVLILEKDGGYSPVWAEICTSVRRWAPKCLRRRVERRVYAPANQNIQIANLEPGVPAEPDRAASEEQNGRKRSRRAIVALIALILLVVLVCLQLVGWVFAIRGRGVANLTVPWCSASLDSTAVGVFDADVLDPATDCGTFHPIAVSSSKGIGCVDLPAKRQMDALLATAIVLPISLTLQTIDFLILRYEGSRRDWKPNDPLRRPWLTMFTGIIIMIALVITSYMHSMHLPEGISDSVLIFRHDDSANSFGVCKSRFHSAALRGSILSWTDGLLWFLGYLYVGQ